MVFLAVQAVPPSVRRVSKMSSVAEVESSYRPANTAPEAGSARKRMNDVSSLPVRVAAVPHAVPDES